MEPSQAHKGADPKLVLQAVDIQGFKSYAGHVRVGAPFGQFTCVVGPNGAGKSVLGEAIAFALGGNAKMMRAKNLGSLVNTGLASGSQHAAAQVTVHFFICCSSTGGGSSAEGAAPMEATASPTVSGKACSGSVSGEAIGGYLGVRRRVTRSGRSEFWVRTCDAATVGAAWGSESEHRAMQTGQGQQQQQQQPHSREGVVATVAQEQQPQPAAGVVAGRAQPDLGSSGRRDFDPDAFGGRWQAVTPDALRTQLEQFRIQTQAIDRIVVTQQRQAVSNVHDPVKLAAFLELLIGTAGYAERVSCLRGEIEGLWGRQEEVEEEAARLELRRQALAPEVAKWREFERQRRSQALRKARVLRQQQHLLERQAAQLEKQVAVAQAQLAEATAAQAAAKAEADGLLVEKQGAARELAAAEASLRKLAEQLEAQQLERARVEVRLKAAEQQAKTAAGGKGGKGGGKGGRSGRGGATAGAGANLEELQKEEATLCEALSKQQAIVKELESSQAALTKAAEELKRKSGSSTLASLQASLDAVQQQLAALDTLASMAPQQQQRQRQQRAASSGSSSGTAGSSASLLEELKRHAAAVEEVEARRREVEQLAGELQSGLPERQGAVEGKERELEGARGELYKAQAAVERLQREQHSIAQQLEQLHPSTRSGGQASCANPANPAQQAQQGRQSVEEAVAELAQRAQRGELPGAFYGRLCSIARIARQQGGCSSGGGSAAVALNAVLMESCNLATCFVVSTRGVAQRVVDHFAERRVGLATCKILDELARPPRDPALGDGLVPLQSLVECDASRAPGSTALLHLMLRNWYLAPNKAAAVEAVLRDRQAGGRRRSIVTAQGELFKADGELVGARRPPRALLPHLLSERYITVGEGTALPTEAELAEERERLERQQAALAPQLQLHSQELQALAEKEQRLGGELVNLQEQRRADSARLQAAERELQYELKNRLAKLQRTGQQLQREAEQAQSAERAAAASREAAAQRLRELEHQREALLLEYAAAAGEVQGGEELLSMERELAELRERLAKARAEAAASEEQLEDCSRQRRQLQRSAQAAAAAAAEAQGLRQRLQELGKAVEEGEAAATGAKQAAGELRKRVGKLERSWKAAVRSHEQATAAVQQLRGQVRASQQAHKAKAEHQAQVAAALAAAQQAASQSAPAGAACAVSQQAAPAAGHEAGQEVEQGSGASAAAAARSSKAKGAKASPGPQLLPETSGGAKSRARSSQNAGHEGGTESDDSCSQAKRARAAHAGVPPDGAQRGQQGTSSIGGGRGCRRRAGGNDSARDSAHESSHQSAVESEEGSSDEDMEGPPDLKAGSSSRRASQKKTAGPARTSRRRLAASKDAPDNPQSCSAGRAATAGAAPSAEASARAARSRTRAAASVAAAAGGSDSDSSDGDVEEGAGRRRRLRRRTTQPSAAPISRSQPRRQQRAQHRQRKQQAGRSQGGSGGEGEGDSGEEEEEEWSEGEVERALAGLEAQQRALKGLESALMAGAVEADAEAEAALAGRQQELEGLEEEVQRLAAQKDSLETERYTRFHKALQAVNARLSGVYGRLTGGAGDAYCSYLENRLAAFSEGVTFHVRPNSSRWRPFGVLSGGQQALATLALCFALQAAFPSSFYFFDEIDCALDTVNAGRVADFISSQSDAQYLVVSHKPQVYEKATTLVGVYTCGAGSEAVTAQFGQQQDGVRGP